jgi:type II secretion system protein N
MKPGPQRTRRFVVPSPSRSRYLVRLAAVTRGRILLVGYGMFAVILFLAFVIASFPYADSISSLLAPMRIKLVFQKQAMSFPMGARLQNVKLISLANDHSLLRSSDVTVSPGLAWFFIGRVCLNVRANIFGGVVDATVRQRARTTTIDFELESLKLAWMSAGGAEPKVRSKTKNVGDSSNPFGLGQVLSGEISGRGSAQLIGPDIMVASARMILYGRNIRALLVNGMRPLELGMVRAALVIEQGIATVQNVKVNGADGDLEADGEIQLAPDISNTTAQLTISLRPSTQARAAFGFLLNLLPHPPNEGPYHLEGVLSSPSLS